MESKEFDNLRETAGSSEANIANVGSSTYLDEHPEYDERIKQIVKDAYFAGYTMAYTRGKTGKFDPNTERRKNLVGSILEFEKDLSKKVKDFSKMMYYYMADLYLDKDELKQLKEDASD